MNSILETIQTIDLDTQQIVERTKALIASEGQHVQNHLSKMEEANRKAMKEEANAKVEALERGFQKALDREEALHRERMASNEGVFESLKAAIADDIFHQLIAGRP